MKRKFIDVTTICNGEKIDVLSISHASLEQLQSILVLAQQGYTISIDCNVEEMSSPASAGM